MGKFKVDGFVMIRVTGVIDNADGDWDEESLRESLVAAGEYALGAFDDDKPYPGDDGYLDTNLSTSFDIEPVTEEEN